MLSLAEREIVPSELREHEKTNSAAGKRELEILAAEGEGASNHDRPPASSRRERFSSVSTRSA